MSCGVVVGDIRVTAISGNLSVMEENGDWNVMEQVPREGLRV